MKMFSIATYAIETAIQTQIGDEKDESKNAALRLLIRQEQAVPLLKAFHKWLDEQQRDVLPKSPIGEAIGYAFAQWGALTLFLTDQHLPIDNNARERALRVAALGRNYADPVIMRSSVAAARDSMAQKLTEFIVDFFANALAEDEMVTEVHIPVPSGRAGGSYQKLEREVADYATVAMRFALNDKMVDRATGRTVEGGEPGEVTELWTFMRARGGGWLLSAIQQT